MKKRRRVTEIASRAAFSCKLRKIKKVKSPITSTNCHKIRNLIVDTDMDKVKQITMQ